MKEFSPESVFIVRNWETVEDIVSARGRLDNEVQSLLHSLEAPLADQTWWQNSWQFKREASTQIYISRSPWQADGEAAVWIGVEGFTASAIFGAEAPPLLYVWVAGRRYGLAQLLAAQLKEGELVDFGDIDEKQHNGYVVRHSVQTCLPDEIAGFADRAIQQILDFLGHYARALESFDEAIRAEING